MNSECKINIIKSLICLKNLQCQGINHIDSTPQLAFQYLYGVSSYIMVKASPVSSLHFQLRSLEFSDLTPCRKNTHSIIPQRNTKIKIKL